jgi:hypothetical protein
MGVMTASHAAIPTGRPFTVAGQGYRRLAHVVGDDAFDARVPFPVRIVPARLLDGLRP